MVLAFVIAVLCAGCGSAGSQSAAPCPTPPQFTYSEDLARTLDQNLLPYLQGQRGEFALETSSQQFTSWIAYSALRWSGIPLRDVVVWFSPERIHFDGIVTRILPFSVSVQFHARVWLEGTIPQIVLEDACLGRHTLPAWLKRLGQRIVNETIQDYSPYFHLDALQVGDGTLSARGRISR